jgi:hypothetical protein
LTGLGFDIKLVIKEILYHYVVSEVVSCKICKIDLMRSHAYESGDTFLDEHLMGIACAAFFKGATN